MSAVAVSSAPMRANADYQLHSWESLPPAARNQIMSVDPPSDGSSVLVGRHGSQLPAKLLNASAARLFASLGRRPRPVRGALSENQLLGLVLDSVLEVSVAGSWAGGPLAYEAMFPSAQVPPPVTRLARMSYDATAWAGGLPEPSAESLSGRLYGYGRIPLSQRWLRAYPGPSSVLAMLDPDRLGGDWRLSSAQTGRVDWLSFHRLGRPAPTSAHQLPYKLYVSPHPEALPKVLSVAVRALADTPASVFKLAPHAAGLLRPDKFVIYLRDAEELASTARRLAEELAGGIPHGVPFSAELTPGGMLSWSGDPAPEAAPAGDRAESWRLSVCRRLAESLVAARRSELVRLTPEGFALGRLGLDGVLIPAFVPSSLAPPTGVADAPPTPP